VYHTDLRDIIGVQQRIPEVLTTVFMDMLSNRWRKFGWLYAQPIRLPYQAILIDVRRLIPIKV